MAIIKSIRTILPQISFESLEPEDDADLCPYIDYLGWVGQKAFGIYIEPVSSLSKVGDYSPPERMRDIFDKFTVKYGGRVFIAYSMGGQLANPGISSEFESEINRITVNSSNRSVEKSNRLQTSGIEH